MISIPLILDEPGIIQVLRDDYGAYDPLQWRVLRWQPGASRYAEFSEIDHTFTPGTAFWLINRSPVTFDVENGSSVSSKSNYMLTLVSGWNQIGNPFAFPIDWNSIQLPANVDPPVYYDGKEYIYEVDLFQPWEGYFIYNGNPGPVNLIIPPVESTGASPKAHDAFDPDSEYRLQITGHVSGFGLMDTQNYIGFRAGATGAKDAWDHYEAPPIGHYLRISTDEKGMSYASNYKSSKGKGEHWDLDVRMSDRVDATVDIDLLEEGTLNDDFRVYVLDADHRCAIPMENGSFRISLTKDRPQRRFRVIIGSADYAAEENDGIPLTPVGYRLRQNYPNPFNPETWISFQLATRDHTTLKIYNILGQEIISLVDGIRETGAHTVRWQGLDEQGCAVPSGVYLYVLSSGEYSAVRKLLMIR
jgi:hypothetical protein